MAYRSAVTSVLAAAAAACCLSALPSGCGFIGRISGMPEGRTLCDAVLAEAFLTQSDIAPRRVSDPGLPFVPATVTALLESPVRMIPLAEEIDRRLRCDTHALAALVARAAAMLGVPVDGDYRAAAPALPNGLPKELEAIVRSLFAGHALFAQALAGLNRDELELVQTAITHYLFSGDERNGMTRRQRQQRLEAAVALAGRIDLQLMAQAASIAAVAIDRALPLLVEHAATLAPARLHTALGDIVIATTDDDLHTGDMPLLLIDPGGNDTYRFTGHAPCSVLIDLTGDDRHETAGGFPAAGLSGMGFLVDIAGNDRYAAERFGPGCGLFGVGVAADFDGNDLYETGLFGQGAGAFGFGILYDRRGNDQYRCNIYGQGMGFTAGVGMLLDGQGNDDYRAGMTIADGREASGAYQTYAQGFGMGIRDFAGGGIGVLYDGIGDDRYGGSYFCQGSAYWLGAGMLLDASGNDRYVGRRYAQGAGVHDAVGLLYDGRGDDNYTSWGVSQGCGHDCGAGMLYERGGNDRYEAAWLCQGAGSSAGTGLFFEYSGNDMYGGTGGQLRGYGAYDERRDMASAGLFIDREGDDHYPDPACALHGLRRAGDIGAGIDAAGGQALLWSAALPKAPPAPFVVHHPAPPDDGHAAAEILPELEAPIFLEDSWQRAASSLAARGPAILPALCGYCDIKDVSVQRAVEETIKLLARSHPDDVHAFARGENFDSRAATILLYALGDVGNSTAEPVFRHFLNHENAAVQAMALRGLYKLHAPVPMEMREKLQTSAHGAVRRFFCLALGAARDPEALTIMRAMLEDQDKQVRYAAYRSLRGCGEAALPILRADRPQGRISGPAAGMINALLSGE